MQPFGEIKQLVPVGADAIMLYFKGRNLDSANGTCHKWLSLIDTQARVDKASWAWLIECVPSYDSLLLIFDLEKIDVHGVYHALNTLSATKHAGAQQPGCIDMVNRGKTAIDIPVWYGAPNSSDLSVISKKMSLSVDEIVDLHTGCEFTVYAVGFAPGFAYMGEIPEALACSRLSTPRKCVPKGAVAIADRQTAVYPSESPGGWNLLGLTPLNMVTYESDKCSPLLKAGDKVQFFAITEEEFSAYNEG